MCMCPRTWFIVQFGMSPFVFFICPWTLSGFMFSYPGSKYNLYYIYMIIQNVDWNPQSARNCGVSWPAYKTQFQRLHWNWGSLSSNKNHQGFCTVDWVSSLSRGFDQWYVNMPGNMTCSCLETTVDSGGRWICVCPKHSCPLARKCQGKCGVSPRQIASVLR